MMAPLLRVKHCMHSGGQLLNGLSLPVRYAHRDGLYRAADWVYSGIGARVTQRWDRQRGQLGRGDL
jgi:hypothetical protein